MKKILALFMMLIASIFVATSAMASGVIADFFVGTFMEITFNYVLSNPIESAAYIIWIASIIAKVTPNETGNKIIATFQKIIDFIAMSTGKTEFRKKE